MAESNQRPKREETKIAGVFVIVIVGEALRSFQSLKEVTGRRSGSGGVVCE
jgi:hypothetical protein